MQVIVICRILSTRIGESNVDTKENERGFLVSAFEDDYGAPCSLQKSSAASKDYIWLGVDDANPQIMAKDAIELGIPTGHTTGWVPYPVPEQELLSTRMHLSRESVARLLPSLIHFVETGELPTNEETAEKIADTMNLLIQK